MQTVTGVLLWIVSNKQVDDYKWAGWGGEVAAAVNLANN